VHGRVAGGRVFILSDRDIRFKSLRPTEPEFQLAGDSERVALTCAGLGVRADELDLPVPLDRTAYRQAVQLLESRGIIENGRLSEYGAAVEALPVDRAWAELLVHASEELVPYVAIMASIESLHRMTREERDLRGLLVPGSDNLTAYNLFADAYAAHGYQGEVYGLPRYLFAEGIEEWAEERGALVKTVEDAALGMASIYRSLELELPGKLPIGGERIARQFADLLARIMPFDLVIEERTASGEEARVSKTSVCSSYGAIAGELRYFADRMGIPRAAIEGTQIPYDLIMKYATHEPPELVFDSHRKRSPLVLRSQNTYFGFELGREEEPIDVFPPELAPLARRKIAESLARFEARHPAVKRNRASIEEIRDVYRRSGGATPRLSLAELTAIYATMLEDVHSLDEFRAAPLAIDADAIVPAAARRRWLALRARPRCATTRCRSSTMSRTEWAESRGCVCPKRWRARCTRVSSRRSIGRCAFTVHRGARGSCVPRLSTSCRSYSSDRGCRTRSSARRSRCASAFARATAGVATENAAVRPTAVVGSVVAVVPDGAAGERADVTTPLRERLLSAEPRTPLRGTSRILARDSSAVAAA
jgi:HrpA-like helicases